MKIDWNKDGIEEARLILTDGTMSHYVSEEQLPETFNMRKVAEAFARTYDHNGSDDDFAVCLITDTSDDEEIKFAFDGHGNFEWHTDRQYISY